MNAKPSASPLKDRWELFVALAKSEGYTVKVCGDYAFRTSRRRNGRYGYIKLWAAPGGETLIVSFSEVN